MKYKFMTVAGIIGVSIVASLATVTSAAASETTKYHGDAEYTTVLWSAVPNADGSTPWPQQYVQQAPGNNQYVFSVNTAGLTCGTFYQSDVYRTGDVAGLIADSTLNAGEDNGKAIQWTTFTTPACQTVTPTATPTETSSPTVPVVTSEPTSPTTSPVTTAPVVTPTQTPTDTATPVGTSPAPFTSSTAGPTVQPTAPQTAGVPPVGTTKPTPRTADRSDASTRAATSLAYTGTNVKKPLLFGLIIFMAGLVLVFGGRALRIRRSK